MLAMGRTFNNNSRTQNNDATTAQSKSVERNFNFTNISDPRIHKGYIHRHQASDDLTVHQEEESRRSISVLNP